MGGRESLERRLAFLDYGDEDRRLLAALAPLLERHADRVVSAFYRHLLSFEETRRLLADPDVKQRLMAKQRAYLLSLSGPEIDGDYLEDRLRIGVVHERIGLPLAWYLGSYAFYFNLLSPLVCEAYRSEPARAERTLGSLMKLLCLDAQLALESYIERRERQLEFLNRELSEAGRDLARQVEERASELRQTERRARAAEELASVATLAAGLAHEIGTPMGVIRGHAELLERSVADERGRWRLRTIQEQIDRISRIIEALLDLARPHRPDFRPTALADVLEGTLAFLGEKFRRRRIEVEQAFREVPPVLGDREKLQQVFLNLYLNAADAMREGGTLRVGLDADEPGQVRVRVADDGAGIPPEALPRIFEPFYTTKESGAGNGLGLVVVKSIVGDHGGTIGVTSEPGRGTEFQVLLPAAPSQPGAMPKREP